MLAAWLPWHFLSSSPPLPAVPASVATGVGAGPRVAAVAATAPPAPASAPVPEAAAAACPHHSLSLAQDARKFTACVSDVRVRQNGSVRSLAVAAEGVSPWSLRVDTAGGRIVAARLSRRAQGTDPSAEFGCTGEPCKGFVLGSPDRHGVRLLQAQAVALSATRRAGQANGQASGAVVLDATLNVPPDRQFPALACAFARVDVVQSDGGTAEFCPAGGAGFEVTADEQTRFVFLDLEGHRIVVTMEADGAVQRLDYGSLACQSGRCSGVSVRVLGDPADPSSQRHFAFSGTTLSDPRNPRVAVTLNGELTMPAQE